MTEQKRLPDELAQQLEYWTRQLRQHRETVNMPEFTKWAVTHEKYVLNADYDQHIFEIRDRIKKES